MKNKYLQPPQLSTALLFAVVVTSCKEKPHTRAQKDPAAQRNHHHHHHDFGEFGEKDKIGKEKSGKNCISSRENPCVGSKLHIPKCKQNEDNNTTKIEDINEKTKKITGQLRKGNMSYTDYKKCDEGCCSKISFTPGVWVNGGIVNIVQNIEKNHTQFPQCEGDESMICCFFDNYGAIVSVSGSLTTTSIEGKIIFQMDEMCVNDQKDLIARSLSKFEQITENKNPGRRDRSAEAR
jgi:hypothetical protein